MNIILMVPIHLDALHLETDQSVVEAMAGFTRLPYFDGSRDVNPDVAYISEEIVSQPFQNQNLRLKAGIHLHWALPDALTKGTHDEQGTTFPRVPNRWLVTRSKKQGANSATIERQWIVESDYLYPVGEGYGGVAFPLASNSNNNQSCPFRYLGRKVPSEVWQEHDPQAEYLERLTALGYGQPTFAAFYPHCHSVFGFYDGDYTGSIAGLQYQVIGWYGHAEHDHLRTFVESTKEGIKESYRKRDNRDPSAQELQNDLVKALEEAFKWTMTIASEQAFPENMICYARLTFNEVQGSTENPAKNDSNVTIAVANTGTEALSAYLARTIDSSHKSIIEDQLEALHLSSRLEHRQLDIGPKFREARHEKGFIAIPSGSLWTIRPETGAASPADAANAQAQEQVTLPEDIAHQLNALNLRQQAYDRATHEIESMRRQLFADWYKYMLCAYPPEDTRDDYPDIDEVQYYIEVKGVAPLQRKIAVIGNLALQRDEAGKIRAAFPLLFSMDAKYQSDLDNNHVPDDLRQRFENEGEPFTLSREAAVSIEEKGSVWWITDAGNTFVVRKEKDTLGIYGVAPTDYPASLGGQLAQAINGLLEAITEHNIASSLLKSGDILDWPGFCLKFKAEDGRARPSHIERIWGLLPDGIQEVIRGVEGGENSLSDIIDALNNILRNPDFYQEDAFKGITISNEATELLGRKRSQEQVVRLNRLLLEACFPQEVAKSPRPYTLKQISAPRYWQPREPVVLIAGEAAKPTPRHGQDGRLREDGLLECQVLPDTKVQYPITRSDFNAITNAIDGLENADHFAFSTWNGQPWHPFLLEWEVEVFPTKEQGNLHPESRAYEPGFITGNYDLAEDQVDLRKQGEGAVTKAASVYSGSSILTPHAGIQLEEKIKKYLEVLDDEDVVESISPKAQQDENFCTAVKAWYKEKPAYAQDSLDIKAIKEWYERKPVYDEASDRRFSDLSEGEKAQDPIYTAIRAYQRLQSMNSLSQSLGGFNEALLMHKQTMQLPIADPLGFDDYQPFADQVRQAVQRSIRSAPEPLNDFHPVRSGAMRLLHLRLVDTFGQVKDLDCSQVITTDLMAFPGDPSQVRLPPRLVQPARLNFRWLSAQQGEQEMNAHPATTPICGWILPNNLDNSLAVYDHQGKALGSITVNPDELWQPPPGSDSPTARDDIPNPHLRKVVKYVVGRGQGFLQDFVSVLDIALENIDPESFAHHQAQALLMGRPIAVVRASLNLGLQGLPAVHQGWNVFRQDMARNTRDTNDFTRVQFPVRLGEYRQLNDGLVGYWIEAGEGDQDGVFYAPQSDLGVEDACIRTHKGGVPLNIHLAVDDPPQTFTMLIDPRGKVHATSGILPTKEIHIPPDQYAAALQAIEITFLSTPILTDQGKMNLPLPTEPGYSWSWLEKAGQNGWSETLTAPTIEKQVFLENYPTPNGAPNGESVWQHLLDPEIGWLKAIGSNSTKASIVAKDFRKKTTLEGDLEGLEDTIETVFDLYQVRIGPVNPKAAFTGSQEIREGWLKLSQAQDTQ